MNNVRIILYPIILVIVLLIIFAQFATPFIRRHHAERTLPIHKIIYIEHGMSNEETNHIISAAVEWGEVTNNQVIFDIERLPQKDLLPSDAIIIFNVTPDYPEILMLDSVNDYTTLGFYSGEGGLSYIALVNERIDEPDFDPVVMHELGHALGLEHITGDEGLGTLMYPCVDLGSPHITDTDLKQFCEIYHCDASKFHGITQIQ